MPSEPNLAALVQRIAGESPGQRLELLAALRRQLDALEAEYVADAVRIGMPWSQIGCALGVSRQAAHKRHAATGSNDPGRKDSEVLVTESAWRAVRLARVEARRLGRAQVGTEHLLLGILCASEGRAYEALSSLGLTLELARQAAEPTLEVPLEGVGDPVPEHEEDTDPLQVAGLSAVARSALEQSLREAVRRKDGYLGDEHLLVALLSDVQGGAARTLERLGVSPARARDEAERLM